MLTNSEDAQTKDAWAPLIDRDRVYWRQLVPERLPPSAQVATFEPALALIESVFMSASVTMVALNALPGVPRP